MMPRRALWVLTTLLAGLWATQVAQAASPRLNIILPHGVQRGAEAVLTFNGSQLADAEEILFYEPGFTVTRLEAGAPNQVKATVQVAPDCRLGEHVAQVRCKSGISDYRVFYVGPFPEVEEKEPNNLFEEPQPISLGVTVAGVVQNEDVDYFVVEASKGQRISAEVEGMRLGATLFDPYLAILDSRRFELAAADDTPLVVQDAVVSVVAPEDGKYIIQLRESAYGGNGNCRYRLHVGTFPRPTGVYPAGGKLGEEIEVTFLGDPSGEFQQKFQLPAQKVEEYGLVPGSGADLAPSPNPFRLFEHANVLEQEPNDAFAEATSAELPLAFNGIISHEGDVDFFKFQAKQGQVYEVECYSRRIRSPLDAVVNLYNAQGGGITGNDDSRGLDSYFRFSVPADGEYFLRVTDHLGRGGKDFVYRVEFQPVVPSLTLGIPRVERYGQYRQQIVVPRGNRVGTLISASRQNFGGELVLDPQDLPAGITVHADPMPANMSLMPVVFEAAADAPIAGKLVDFTARHADESTGIRGRFTNRADFVVANPGQSLYRWKDVEKLPVAVVEEVPFKLELIEPKVPLVLNGEMQLKVVAQRGEGFTRPISVQLPFRPPGVNAASSVTIPEGQNEVLYPINAAGNAQVGSWKVFVLGSADVGGAAWVSSDLAKLEIAPAFVQFAMERAVVEVGQSAQILCKVQHDHAFEGPAKVQLVGLPNKVTAAEVELTKDMQELVFTVQTDPSSPVGQHKNIFCRVTITQNDEPIVHGRVGATELRIDPPPPKPVQPPPQAQAQPQPAAQPEPPKEAPKKPLSRLEMLRLEAQKRAEAARNGGGAPPAP